MKKIVLLLLVLMSFVLVGCGGSSSSSSSYKSLKSMFKDIWEEGTYIVDEEDQDYYLVWRGTRDGMGKIIYEGSFEAQTEVPLMCMYYDRNGVYYSLVEDNNGQTEFLKVIDFYNEKWNISPNITGSLETVNYDEGYCIVKAQGPTESCYYVYDMSNGFLNEYKPDTKIKIIFIKSPKSITPLIKLIFKIKKDQN